MGAAMVGMRRKIRVITSSIAASVFWELISGDEALYVKIIEPLGHRAKERNEDFLRLYDQAINRFVSQFMQSFFAGDLIDWEALVRFNSAAKQNRRLAKHKG